MKAQGTATNRTIRRCYRVDRREIAFLRFAFEACDGIATLTTLDPASGRVAIDVAPGCQAEVDEILHGLTDRIRMEPMESRPTE